MQCHFILENILNRERSFRRLWLQTAIVYFSFFPINFLLFITIFCLIEMLFPLKKCYHFIINNVYRVVYLLLIYNTVFVLLLIYIKYRFLTKLFSIRSHFENHFNSFNNKKFYYYLVTCYWHINCSDMLISCPRIVLVFDYICQEVFILSHGNTHLIFYVTTHM